MSLGLENLGKKYKELTTLASKPSEIINTKIKKKTSQAELQEALESIKDAMFDANTILNSVEYYENGKSTAEILAEVLDTDKKRGHINCDQFGFLFGYNERTKIYTPDENDAFGILGTFFKAVSDLVSLVVRNNEGSLGDNQEQIESNMEIIEKALFSIVNSMNSILTKVDEETKKLIKRVSFISRYKLPNVDFDHLFKELK